MADYNLSNADLQRLLASAGNYGGNSIFGPSFLDQARNYATQKSALKSLSVGENISQEAYDATKASINSGIASAAIGGGLAAMQGATSILSNTQNLAQIADTTQYQNQIDDLGQIGYNGYNSFDQLSMDYGRLNAPSLDFDYDTIRGGSKSERIGNVLSSTLSGASTGLTVGGPWGALAGAVVGLGSGVAGLLVGDTNAEFEKQRLEQSAQQNISNSMKNLNAASEQMMDSSFRHNIGNRAAEGGAIERKQMTLKQFADRVLSKQRRNDTTHSAGIIRTHCKGGTMIRIKVK